MQVTYQDMVKVLSDEQREDIPEYWVEMEQGDVGKACSHFLGEIFPEVKAFFVYMGFGFDENGVSLDESNSFSLVDVFAGIVMDAEGEELIGEEGMLLDFFDITTDDRCDYHGSYLSSFTEILKHSLPDDMKVESTKEELLTVFKEYLA